MVTYGLANGLCLTPCDRTAKSSGNQPVCPFGFARPLTVSRSSCRPHSLFRQVDTLRRYRERQVESSIAKSDPGPGSPLCICFADRSRLVGPASPFRCLPPWSPFAILGPLSPSSCSVLFSLILLLSRRLLLMLLLLLPLLLLYFFLDSHVGS